MPFSLMKIHKCDPIMIAVIACRRDMTVEKLRLPVALVEDVQPFYAVVPCLLAV